MARQGVREGIQKGRRDSREERPLGLLNIKKTDKAKNTKHTRICM
jgi:hypothetical protein